MLSRMSGQYSILINFALVLFLIPRVSSAPLGIVHTFTIPSITSHTIVTMCSPWPSWTSTKTFKKAFAFCERKPCPLCAIMNLENSTNSSVPSKPTAKVTVYMYRCTRTTCSCSMVCPESQETGLINTELCFWYNPFHCYSPGTQ